jgi:hypothetical protein
MPASRTRCLLIPNQVGSPMPLASVVASVLDQHTGLVLQHPDEGCHPASSAEKPLLCPLSYRGGLCGEERSRTATAEALGLQPRGLAACPASPEVDPGVRREIPPDTGSMARIGVRAATLTSAAHCLRDLAGCRASVMSAPLWSCQSPHHAINARGIAPAGGVEPPGTGFGGRSASEAHRQRRIKLWAREITKPPGSVTRWAAP